MTNPFRSGDCQVYPVGVILAGAALLFGPMNTTASPHSDDGSAVMTIQVRDAVTRQPVAGASVFLFASTVGGRTDAAGSITLHAPVAKGMELNAYAAGYILQSRHIDPIAGREYQYLISLQPAGETLKTERSVLRHEFARTEILGKSIRGNQAVLLNPEALFTEETSDGYTAWASEMLRVENGRLGYTIHLALTSMQRTQWVRFMRGRWYFEPMQPRDESEQNLWEERRAMMYRGSLIHFTRALIRDVLREEEFETYLIGYIAAPLYKLQMKSETIASRDDYLRLDPTTGNWRLGKDGWALRVKFVSPDQKGDSYIFFGETPIMMRPDGTIMDYDVLLLGGNWRERGLADAIPWTYEPGDVK